MIGGISSGLKSRERSCPYAFLAPGSGVRIIGGRKFPRAKQQAATQVNLDVASSHLKKALKKEAKFIFVKKGQVQFMHALLVRSALAYLTVRKTGSAVRK